MVGCTFTTCLSNVQQEHRKRREEKFKQETAATETVSAASQRNAENAASSFTTTTASSSSSSGSSGNSSTLTNLARLNFNLRGHKAHVRLVRWNEPYQKLATCDSKGVIYVWIRYEGRWSIELINDRGNSVSDFAWSHDGRMAVICYQDGFVLVGSVSGQRYWSHMYEMAGKTITCATWAPNDTFILLGVSDGSLMLLDENGLILSRHELLRPDQAPLTSLTYNCAKFFIEELINMNNCAGW